MVYNKWRVCAIIIPCTAHCDFRCCFRRGHREPLTEYRRRHSTTATPVGNHLLASVWFTRVRRVVYPCTPCGLPMYVVWFTRVRRVVYPGTPCGLPVYALWFTRVRRVVYLCTPCLFFLIFIFVSLGVKIQVWQRGCHINDTLALLNVCVCFCVRARVCVRACARVKGNSSYSQQKSEPHRSLNTANVSYFVL